jgi:hypothetical protein
LKTTAADDPVTCAEYARGNNPLNLDGWKHFQRLAKREKKLKRMINQAKLKPYHREPFGSLVLLSPQTMHKQ